MARPASIPSQAGKNDAKTPGGPAGAAFGLPAVESQRNACSLPAYGRQASRQEADSHGFPRPPVAATLLSVLLGLLGDARHCLLFSSGGHGFSPLRSPPGPGFLFSMRWALSALVSIPQPSQPRRQPARPPTPPITHSFSRTTTMLDFLLAVGVAQLVERRSVAPNVAGSIPVSHPNKSPIKQSLFRIYSD
jgi:hypothetical protein